MRVDAKQGVPMNEEQHERKQDEQLASHEATLREQARYLHDIRNHFIPEEEARLKRILRYAVMPFVKLVALVVFVAGVWDFFIWFVDRYEMRTMADRYANVAIDLYYRENNPDIATSFLDQAIDLCGGESEYRFLRAYIDGLGAASLVLDLDRPLKKEELDRVQHAYAEAKFLEGLEPKRAEPYLLQAQALMAMGEADRAEPLLRKALALDPENDFAHLRLAQLLLVSRGDVSGAADELDQAAEDNPESKWLWLCRGDLENDYRKNPDAARTCYEKALAIDPKFDLALNRMGWTWMAHGKKDYTRARALALKAFKVNPASARACLLVGLSYAYERNFLVAKMWFDKAIALDESFLSAYKCRGVLNVEMKEFEAAVTDFDAALALDPANADLYVNRARALVWLKRMPEAIRDLNFALELDPKSANAWYYLGEARRAMDETDESLLCYDRALALDDKFDEAYEGKAALLAALGKREEALAAIDRAIEFCECLPDYYYVKKGLILKRFEDWKGALAAFAKARELDPKNAEAWQEESLAAEKLGDAARAQAARRKARELD